MAVHLNRYGSFIPNYIEDSVGWAYDPGFDYGGGLASLQNDRIESSTESEDTESEDAGAEVMAKKYLTAADLRPQVQDVWDETSGWTKTGPAYEYSFLSEPSNWIPYAKALGYTGPFYNTVASPNPEAEGGVDNVIAPEFTGFIKKAQAAGYDLAAQADQINNRKVTFGLLTPDGSLQGEQIRGSGTLFEKLSPMALMALGASPLGGMIGSSAASTLGISGLTAAQTAALGSAIGSGGITALSGGDIGDVLKSAVAAGLSQVVSGITEPFASSVGSEVLKAGAPQWVADAATSAVRAGASALPQAVITGDFGNVLTSALTAGATSGITSGVSNLTGLSSKDINAAVNFAQGAANGDLTKMLSGAASFTDSPDLALAARASAVVKAVESGNPAAILSAGQAFGKQLDAYNTQQTINAAYQDPTRALDVIQSGASTGTTQTLPPDNRDVAQQLEDAGLTEEIVTNLPGTIVDQEEVAALPPSDIVEMEPGSGGYGELIDVGVSGGMPNAGADTSTTMADQRPIILEPTYSVGSTGNVLEYPGAFGETIPAAVANIVQPGGTVIQTGADTYTVVDNQGNTTNLDGRGNTIQEGIGSIEELYNPTTGKYELVLSGVSPQDAQPSLGGLISTGTEDPDSPYYSLLGTGSQGLEIPGIYGAGTNTTAQQSYGVPVDIVSEILGQAAGQSDVSTPTQGQPVVQTPSEVVTQPIIGDQQSTNLDKILESLLPTDQALAPDSGDIDALLNEIVGGVQQPTGTEVTERERTAFEEANMLPEGGTLETTLPDTQTEAQPVTQPDVIDQLVKAGLTEDTDVLLPTTQETTADTQPVTQPTEDVVTTTPVEAPAPGAGQTTEVVTETPTDGVVLTETPSGGPVTTETPTDLPSDVTGGVTETSTEETTEDTTVTQPSTTGEATTLPAQGVVQDLIDAGLTQEGGGVTLEDVVSTPTTPTTPTDTTETATTTTPTGPAGDAVVTQTPTSSEQLTAQDVTSIVNQAIAANPSLSAQDVQNAINDAISNLPAGITAADVNTAINSALSNLPASVTPEQMQSAIASATKEIQGSQLTSSDVSTIVNNAISANPGLSVTDVQSVVNNAISNIPAGLTAADVNTAISEALNNLPAFVTPEQMQGAVSAAIQQIQGSQLTSSDVSNIVSDALAANPGLNIQDVENVVNTAVSNIPAGLTATDVNTAISNALNNLPASVTPEQMQGAVNAAIQEIQKSQVTTQDVSNIVNQAIAANPGLSTQDVERVVNNAIANIPAGLTKDDVNAAINSALGGLPDSVTPEEMQGAVNNAIQEIQKSQITTQDVSNIVNEAISSNPGLSTEDVERVVNTALSNLPAGLTASDVNTAISNALSALPDFVTPDQMQGAVNIAIEEIKEGQLTANQVNSIVNAALTSNPGLKIEDVQEVVSNAIDNLPAGITAADVNTAVTTAISNLPASVTPAQLTAAVNNAVSTAVSTAVQTSQAQSTNQMQQLMAMLGSRGGQRQAAQPTVYTPVLANFKDTFDVDDLFMGGNDRTTVEDLLSIIGAGRRS